MKTRWDAFKQLDEEYMHKKLGSVVYEGKSTNDDQEKANVINRFFASVGKHDGDTKVEVLTTSASGDDDDGLLGSSPKALILAKT